MFASLLSCNSCIFRNIKRCLHRAISKFRLLNTKFVCIVLNSLYLNKSIRPNTFLLNLRPMNSFSFSKIHSIHLIRCFLHLTVLHLMFIILIIISMIILLYSASLSYSLLVRMRLLSIILTLNLIPGSFLVVIGVPKSLTVHMYLMITVLLEMILYERC